MYRVRAFFRDHRVELIKSFYSFVLIPIFLLIIMLLAYAWLRYVTLECISVKSFLLSFFFLSLIQFLLLSFVKNTKISILIISILLFLLLVINQIKLCYMGEPLFISDFNFIQNYSNISNFTQDSFFDVLFLTLWRSLPVLFLFAFLFFLACKFNVKVEGRKFRVIGGLSFLLLVILLYPCSFSKKIYLKYVYTDVTRSNLDTFDSYPILYGYYGILGGIHYQYVNSLLGDKPRHYNRNDLQRLEDDVSNETKNIGSPNIVVILSESFFDVQNLEEDITFDKAITKNYNELKDVGHYVNVITPSFGSMTANVTFELLTGANMSYFASGYVPFLELYRDNKERPSIVRELRNNGYQTSIILGGDSYHSNEIMKRIGFADYTLADQGEYVKGFFVSDDHMADLAIECLKAHQRKKFCMIETMQSHLDYPKNKYDKYNIQINNSHLSWREQDTLLSYAQGIYDADQMLKKVYDYINTIEEDTILLFFGDHLPILKSDVSRNVYDYLKYFNTGDDLINTYRKYNTGALVLSNFDLDVEIPDYLSYDLLLTYLVNHMNLELSPYYRWLYSTRDILPAYNRFVAVDVLGRVHYTSQLVGKERKMYDLRMQMIYKEFIE